jgi:hypothetical protein
LPASPGAQLLDALVTDQARGHVDDPQQRDLVVRAVNQSQIGDDVLDLAPLIKAHRAHQLVPHPVAHEGILERTRLGVGAEHDGAVSEPADALADHAQRLLHHVFGLFTLVIGFKQAQRLSLWVLRPQRLVMAQDVARDHVPRGLENGAGGAIVLL